MEKAGAEGFAAVSLADAVPSLIGKVPKLIKGAAGLFEDARAAWGGAKLAEALPEIGVELPKIEVALPEVDLGVANIGADSELASAGLVDNTGALLVEAKAGEVLPEIDLGAPEIDIGAPKIELQVAGSDVPNRLAAEVETSASGSPSHLVSGQVAEAEQLEILSSSGKVPFTPTPEQVNSAAFKVIVGDAKYTRSGDLVSTIYDGLNADGLAEIKNGSSELSSSYQLRLQTYGSLVNDTPLTIYTSRPVNPVFQDYLTRWGVSVKPLPH